jgi:hypothetical protein
MSSGPNMDGVPTLLPLLSGSLSTLSDSNNSGSLAATPVVNRVLQTPGEGLDTLEDFFKSLRLSPPSKSSQVYMSEIMNRVNALLAPIHKGWENLDSTQQAKMSFLVLRNQPCLLEVTKYKGVEVVGTSNVIAQELWDVVATKTTSSFKRVDALVQRGGDNRHDEEEGEDCFASFLNNPETAVWSDNEQSRTLFNRTDGYHRQMKPLFRFQEDSSTVCAWVAVANAIYYSRCLHTGTRAEEAVEQYALNINRFMRNHCSDEELFGIIFMGQGSFPVDLLLKLLQPFNTNVRSLDFAVTVDIKPEDGEDEATSVALVYLTVKKALRTKGALIVEEFKIFDAFRGNMLRFDGRCYDDKTKSNETHAVLVVGVRLTDSIENMGGIEFLIQNSWERKPFFTVGYDLLRSMEVTTFRAVKKGLNFSVASHDSFEHATRKIQSGSPYHAGRFDEQLENEQLQNCRNKESWWSLDNSTTGGSDDSTPRSHYETDPGYYYHDVSDFKGALVSL